MFAKLNNGGINVAGFAAAWDGEKQLHILGGLGGREAVRAVWATLYQKKPQLRYGATYQLCGLGDYETLPIHLPHTPKIAQLSISRDDRLLPVIVPGLSKRRPTQESQEAKTTLHILYQKYVPELAPAFRDWLQYNTSVPILDEWTEPLWQHATRAPWDDEQELDGFQHQAGMHAIYNTACLTRLAAHGDVLAAWQIRADVDFDRWILDLIQQGLLTIPDVAYHPPTAKPEEDFAPADPEAAVLVDAIAASLEEETAEEERRIDALARGAFATNAAADPLDTDELLDDLEAYLRHPDDADESTADDE